MSNPAGDDLSLITVETGGETDRLGRTVVVAAFDEATYPDKFDVSVAKERQQWAERAAKHLDIRGAWSASGGSNTEGVHRALDNRLMAAVALAMRPEQEKKAPATPEIFEAWARGVVDRVKPKLYSIAADGNLMKFTVGERLVNLIGAPPGAGKTALVCQMVVDALRLPGQEHLRALISNVEMSPGVLLDRQLSRLSGVPYGYVRRRDYLPEWEQQIAAGIGELRGLMPRIEFLRPPFSLGNLQTRAEEFQANIVVVDYLQRFSAQGVADQRMQTNAAMSVCWDLADEKRAVIVVSAVSRHKGKDGSTYDTNAMSLASFRESSELEYGSDSAHILCRLNANDDKAVNLRCFKNRHGSLEDIELEFDGDHQKFDTPLPVWEAPNDF